MIDYIDLDYKPTDKDLVVMYYVESAKQGNNLEYVSEEIAKESSIGTWTDIVTMSKDIAERLKPSVFYIDSQKHIIKIAYNEDLFEANNISQILSAIAGNIFGMKALKNLRLLDLSFPKNIMTQYSGPQFGINGIRRVTKTERRPLLGTIVKPKVGLNELEHAKVCKEAWFGGLDIVKDDENLTSMRFNKFQNRIEETFKVKNKVEKETGEKKFYMPNITAKLSEMKKRADIVKTSGGEYIMVDVFTVGFSALQEIRDYMEDLGLIIHAHRAMHAAFTRNKKHGITMLALAKILRLIGVDQLHTGTIIGKMEGDKQEVLNTNKVITQSKVAGNNKDTLNQNWWDIKPTLPVASGGLSPIHIPELVKILGKDMVFQFGGGCHGHPNGTLAGAKAIRQALNASLDKVDLDEFAIKHMELKKAIEKWGN